MAIHDTPDVLKGGTFCLTKRKVIPIMINGTQIFIVTPEESGDWYFGIREGSDINKYSSQVTGFEVLENVFAPWQSYRTYSCAGCREGNGSLCFMDASCRGQRDGQPLSQGYSMDNVCLRRKRRTCSHTRRYGDKLDRY